MFHGPTKYVAYLSAVVEVLRQGFEFDGFTLVENLANNQHMLLYITRPKLYHVGLIPSSYSLFDVLGAASQTSEVSRQSKRADYLCSR
jgi:hypothetical protein